VHDPSLGNREAERRDERKLARLGRVDREHVGAVQYGRALPAPVIEQGLRVEDRVLPLAKEAGHGDAAQDHRRRRRVAKGIEAVIAEIDPGEGDPAPLQRGEQGFEPSRMLIEDCDVGGHVSDAATKGTGHVWPRAA
jgi:hypothetical protein